MSLLSSGPINAFYMYGTAAFMYEDKLYTVTFLSGATNGVQHYALSKYHDMNTTRKRDTAISGAVDILLTGLGFIPGVGDVIGVTGTAAGIASSIVDIVKTSH